MPKYIKERQSTPNESQMDRGIHSEIFVTRQLELISFSNNLLDYKLQLYICLIDFCLE